jgi:uroporphyrinogen decarboxylase
MTATIFNAWAVLRHLVEPPHEHKPPSLDASIDAPSQWIRAAWDQNPRAVQKALQTIGHNLASFARRCLSAGADGIFLSVRDDWVDIDNHDNLYRQLVGPTDLAILEAVSNARFNMLHVCGKALDLRRFNNYPVHAINWADRAAGPAISEAKEWLKPAICAGVDNLNTLPKGSPQDVALEISDALAQAGERPIMICPGCTFDPKLVPANPVAKPRLSSIIAAHNWRLEGLN